MTRAELNQQMAATGKTGLLITAETRMELLQARVEELEAQLAAVTAENDALAEQSASQRQYILELLEKEARLHNLLDRALEALA